MAAGDITADLAEASKYVGASFDGVDDYVEIPHHASQLGANLSNGFTISAWIYPKTLGEGDQGVIIDKAMTVNGFGIRMLVPQKCYFKINNSVLITCGNNSLVFKRWSHLLITVNSIPQVNFYVNGVLSGTENQEINQQISTITATSIIRIGNLFNSTNTSFNGSIRNVKMWNRVLTAAERASDYAGYNSPRDGLILDVPLQDDYNDKSPTGLTGTNSGTYLVNNLPNRIKADVNSLNLAAVTDKPIVVLPVGGRDAAPIVIGVNRSA
jgi:hypothetical protein